MFRRVMVSVTGLTALLGWSMAVPAGAAAANRTTITITCDRATASAIAVVTLYDRFEGTQVGTPTTVRCGSGDADLDRRTRVVLELPSPVSATAIGGYDVSSDAQVTSCEGGGTLTFELACTGPTGVGAKITVR